jgi:hypothetical protein
MDSSSDPAGVGWARANSGFTSPRRSTARGCRRGCVGAGLPEPGPQRTQAMAQIGFHTGWRQQGLPQTHRLVGAAGVVGKPVAVQHQGLRAIGSVVAADAQRLGQLLQCDDALAAVERDAGAQRRDAGAHRAFEFVSPHGLQQFQRLFSVSHPAAGVVQQRDAYPRERTKAVQRVFVCVALQL